MREEFAKNSKHIPSEQELRTVLSSPEAKRLIELLRSDGGTSFENAAKAVRQGDEEQARRLLSPLLRSEEAKTLLEQLGKSL